MNRIDLTQLGGFPLEQDTLKFMQDNAADAFSAIAKLCGDKTILTGVVKTGSLVSDGWIAYGGELIKFVGGNYAAQVVISETAAVDQALFEDGSTKDVYFTKIATCGAAGSFPFSDLKPAGMVPKGIISMWSGAIVDIPWGYALCDGTNGTPNLSGRFIVGYNATDTDYNAIGKSGGEKQHILTIAEMPAHTHTQTGIAAANSGTSGTGANNGTSNTGSTGGGLAHENRPPYYTLAYIIKL
ncbi:MAG: hypothetical protein KGM16_17905 [Bacteroidota bacterium]|nr:hypothetical protein [Bacteroidota bacterium]